SGDEGLTLLQAESRNVALIISDQRMPGMSGDQFLEKARRIVPDAMRFLLTGYADMEAVIKAVNNGGIHRYLTKPWNDDALLLHVRQCLEHFELLNENRRLTALTIEQNEALSDLNRHLEHKVNERTREIQVKNKALLEINRMLEGSIMDAVRLLVALAERLSPSLSVHLREVARLARLTGQALGLAKPVLDRLELAGMVHDLGLLGMPEDLWTKDLHSMNDEQRKTFLAHPVAAAIVLENVERLSEISQIVLAHHEHVDGKGFPNGLRGDQIPIESRILAIVSEYCRIVQGLPRDPQKLTRTARRYFDADTWKQFSIRDNPEAVIREMAEKLILMEANRRFDVNIISAFIQTTATAKTLPEVHTVAIEGLVAGMVLMEDLRIIDGRLLLTKGTPLKEKSIDSIKTIAQRGMIPERLAVAMTAAGERDDYE
ncbi:MAG: HD domain-containing protein, partial [Desulfatitalea sp.]|nr:HD domain-containing protein [Desulfatitalea sp.]